MNKMVERRQNLKMIIEMLRLNGPVSQNVLKDQCRLQASTISYLINDLKTEKLVIDLGKVETQGKVGKPANLIGLNNDEAQFLGVYVEDKCLYIYVVGIDGRIIHCASIGYAIEEMETHLFDGIRRMLQTYGKIRGIGIAIKAIVYSDGRIYSGIRRDNANREQHWDLANLPDALRSAFPGTPIIVENDANCAAALYRYETKCDNFVLYILNDIPFGIGCGLMVHGQIYRGARGAAGEFFLKDLNSSEVADTTGDKDSVLEKTLVTILPHVLQTAYLLDPECFVLTGSMFRDITEAEIARAEKILEPVPIKVNINSGKERNLNPACGAAFLAINQFIEQYLEEVTKR